MKKWIILTEDGNGKIHFFTKIIEDDAVEAFRYEVEGWNAGTILAMFRKDDITQICDLGF